MRKIALVALLPLLATPAFAASMTEKTGVNSVLGVAPSTKDFVQEAAISDMFEIESSKVALTKLNGADKSFADQMITDHTKTSSELANAAQSLNQPIPGGLDSSHQSMLDKLKSLNGDEFRRQYLSDQVSGHESAVSLFKRYADGGDNATLKSWAGTTLPTLQHHLDMARGLYKNS